MTPLQNAVPETRSQIAALYDDCGMAAFSLCLAVVGDEDVAAEIVGEACRAAPPGSRTDRATWLLADTHRRAVLAVRAVLRHSQAARAISAHAMRAHTVAARDALVRNVPPAKRLQSDSHRWSAHPLSSALRHSSESRRWSRHMHALVAISQKPPPWPAPRVATTTQLRMSLIRNAWQR